MSRFTPFLLLVVVVALGYVAYRQTEREKARPLVTIGPLFEGVEARRVTAIRLENIRSSRHIRFQRDAGGRWFLTDPIAWPVEPGLMDKVLKVIERNRADAIPDVLAEEAAESFEPPRGFLETEELLENGEKRLVRIEVGAPDLDGLRMYVRRDGAILRTTRNIDSLFDFTLNDYRDRRLFSIPPAGIASIERVGGWYEGEAAEERLGMLASPFGYGWRIHEPVRVQGDPTLFELWTRFLGSARARRFASDLPEEDLSAYNLDPPWVTLKLTSGGGATQSLHFSGKDGRVYAMRDEAPTIFELDVETGLRLREPLMNFYDGAFARVAREQVRRVWIRRASGMLRISRAKDRWTIAEKLAGQSEFTMEIAADPELVADFLNETETAEVVRYFTDVEPSDFFPEGEERDGLWVESADGIRHGGSFGAEVTTPEGTRLTPFLRDGDTVVGSVDSSVAALCQRPLAEFLDRDLWALDNIRLRALLISDGSRTREFQRSNKHDWRPIDADVPARELDPVLDYLLFMRALRHVPEGERSPLEDAITVTFVEAGGVRHEATIGRVNEGEGVDDGAETQVQVGPIRAVLRFPKLYDDLRTILSP